MSEEIVITTMDNGPLLVKGPAVLRDSTGNQFTLERAQFALCRCGQSGNKPFCDGSHKGRFEDGCRAPG